MGHYALVQKAWEHLDALVLESAGEAGSDGVGLTRLIGLVDYVDRTVLPSDEMQSILARLIGSGLVEEADGRFRRTTAGQELHSLCPAKAPRDRARWIATYLRDRVECVSDDEWSLSSARYHAALHAYRDEMAGLQ